MRHGPRRIASFGGRTADRVAYRYWPGAVALRRLRPQRRSPPAAKLAGHVGRCPIWNTWKDLLPTRISVAARFIAPASAMTKAPARHTWLRRYRRGSAFPSDSAAAAGPALRPRGATTPARRGCCPVRGIRRSGRTWGRPDISMSLWHRRSSRCRQARRVNQRRSNSPSVTHPVNASHSQGVNTSAGPSGFLESRIPTYPVASQAISTHSLPPLLCEDLNHSAPERSMVTACISLLSS